MTTGESPRPTATATRPRTDDAHDLGADIVQLRRRLPSLEAVERRRGQLWLVAGVLLVATSVAVLLLVADPTAADAIPDNPGLRIGFLVVSVAFLLYVFDQERRMRRLSDALVKERVLSTALEARVRDLSTLSRVGQVVNSVLTMEEVLEIILTGAFELTGAVTGSVMLAEDDELVVAVSAGVAPAPAGARQSLSSGVAGRVATQREPLLITGAVGDRQVRGRQERQRPAASSVIAPMIVGDQLLGVLALERPADAAAFTEWELRAVSLFASNAATAVTNARRYESERANVTRLADMLERRAEFVATLVHDLKAPLAAILGFVSLLQRRAEEMTDEQRSTSLAHIEVSANDLLTIVDDVLRGASAEASVNARPELVDVADFAQELAETTRHLAESREGAARTVQVTVPPGTHVYTDPAALRSVLMNLLENAVKYSPAGSPIELTATRTDDEIRLAVTDHGDGIPVEEHDLIFERFRQRTRSRGSGVEGVGLGLYIVRSLVVAQGGRIWVESEPGVGTTFHVAFPRRNHAGV